MGGELKIVQITDADKEKLRAFELSLDCVRSSERPLLEINGFRVAVISAEELEYFQALEDAEDLRQAREAMAEPGERVNWETLKDELGL